MSYTKTNKLVTALYMVTDIIDKEEPIRNKLRTLGTEIISDMHSTPANACNKIDQVMSFLGISSAVSIISEMNCSILQKEFSDLSQSIKANTDKVETTSGLVDLSEFFTNSPLEGWSKTGVDKRLPPPSDLRSEYSSRGELNFKGHTRIGVQKGSTLMKALSDKTQFLSNRNDLQGKTLQVRDFDILKKQRRDDIINIIKIVGKSATIKDIKDKVQTIPEQASFLVSCGEKTLQRELVSMIKEGVLNKTGEKRWSRYFIK